MYSFNFHISNESPGNFARFKNLLYQKASRQSITRSRYLWKKFGAPYVSSRGKPISTAIYGIIFEYLKNILYFPSKQDKTGVNEIKRMIMGRKTGRLANQPVEMAHLPVEMGNLPVEITNLPVEMRNQPVEMGNLPVEMTNLPVEMEILPVEMINLPVEIGNLPVEMTHLPVEMRILPVEMANLPFFRKLSLEIGAMSEALRIFSA